MLAFKPKTAPREFLPNRQRRVGRSRPANAHCIRAKWSSPGNFASAQLVYIGNNPLSGTDPTGYIAHCMGNAVCQAQDDAQFLGGEAGKLKNSLTYGGAPANNQPGGNGTDSITPKGASSTPLNGQASSIGDLDQTVGQQSGNADFQTASDPDGAMKPAIPPDHPKVEGGGYVHDTPEEAAIAAGKAYGPESLRRHQEAELGLDQQNQKWGYLTPGWGPVDATNVDPKPVFAAYKNAKLTVVEWMHSHFDGQLNFSANDFGLVFGYPAQFRTFMVNKLGEVRSLSNKNLTDAQSQLPQGETGLPGLKKHYKDDGLPGEKQ